MNVREGIAKAIAVARRQLPSDYFKEGRVIFSGEAHCRGMRRARRRRLYAEVVKAAKRGWT